MDLFKTNWDSTLFVQQGQYLLCPHLVLGTVHFLFFLFFKPDLPPPYISQTFLWAAEEGACKCLQLPQGYLRFPLSLLQLSWMSEHIGIKYKIHKPRLNRKGKDC